MLTTPAPAPPTTSTTTSPASPSSPLSSPGTSTRRLRGLSYLRSYTQHHLPSLHSGNSSASSSASRPGLTRSRTQPNSPSAVESTDSAQQDTHATNTGSSREQPAYWLPSAAGLFAAPARPAEPVSTPPAPALQPPPPPPPPSTATPTMTRSRAQTTGATHISTAAASPSAQTAHTDAMEHGTPKSQLPTIRLIPHQDPRAARPSLIFPPISRTLPSTNSIIRVGRYSERDSTTEPASNAPSAAPVGFKSKVVSRRHCELWCEDGQWYIKDVKSSSGTFLNHIRLSQPGMESDKFKIKDGDVIQLGIDFRGGEEMIFRCVKIRVECNRGWQRGINEFNKSTHQQLQKLAKKAKADATKASDSASVHSSECAICLMSIAPCQSLFVAPCSHVWHYKCIRKLLNGPTYPIFLCPNCRAVADLEADVEEPDDDWEEALGEENLPLTPRPTNDEGQREGSSIRQNSETNNTSEGNSPPPGEGDEDVAVMGARISNLNLGNPFDAAMLGALPNGSRDDSQNEGGSGSATSAPVPIRPAHGERNESLDTPTGLENPLTPRNDAGPFILDGGAGQRTVSGSRSLR